MRTSGKSELLEAERQIRESTFVDREREFSLGYDQAVQEIESWVRSGAGGLIDRKDGRNFADKIASIWRRP